jgi:DNA repair and recombination RAD54-like protein
MWTLLCQSFDGAAPLAKRVLIVCPTSLVANWDSECVKWLNGRVKTTPIAESTRADVVHSVTQFLSPRNTSHVLIISYETFRLHAVRPPHPTMPPCLVRSPQPSPPPQERFSSASACDLLICDEAHRLKNDETLTNKALDSLACRRRILLSGTPIQNHLDEFYAMVNFANPGLLGTRVEFHKK